MTAHEALRQCVEAMKEVDFADCGKDDARWHKLNAAQQVAEEVLKRPEQEPVAYMRKWKADGEVPHKVKGRWVPKFRILPITPTKLFSDDVALYAAPVAAQPAVAAVTEELLKNPQLLRIVQSMDEANRADDFGKRAREAYEELCEWIAEFAAPQPAAAPITNGLASFYLAEDGMTCTHEVGDCKLPIWCKDSPDAYNALRIISSLYNRANLSAAAPSGDAPDLSFLEPLYRWMARAQFARPNDEITAARFAQQMRAAITATKE